MYKESIKDRILEIGIIPVVRASSAAEAIAAVHAICLGGIPIVEITMTVPGAIETIRQVAKTLGDDVLVGAGTVLDADTARRCIDAGAEFIVGPGLDVATIELVAKAGKVMMAGTLTPSEVIAAWNAGSDFVKVFPCGQVGGPSYIKALRGPFPQISFVPTGGVNLKNAAEFIRAGSAALGVGGELVQVAALQSGHPEIITASAREFIGQVKLARESLGTSSAQLETTKVRS
jgi:2-dehydro-3-deoxyphosphogluconate aldolase / (4S)-4-hydroxy-2-oxoglutarate aldolase